MEIGEILSGTVASITPFGAFVQIAGEKATGLVHISEIDSGYVNKVEDYLKIGDKVKVKVVKIDERGKISLSIKRAHDEQAQKRAEKKAAKPHPPVNHRPDNSPFSAQHSTGELSFEDKLSRFKKDSDENMQALRKSRDSKRSGGYKRGR